MWPVNTAVQLQTWRRWGAFHHINRWSDSKFWSDFQSFFVFFLIKISIIILLTRNPEKHRWVEDEQINNNEIITRLHFMSLVAGADKISVFICFTLLMLAKLQTHGHNSSTHWTFMSCFMTPFVDGVYRKSVWSCCHWHQNSNDYSISKRFSRDAVEA